MNTKQLIESLKQEAAANPVSNAVLHMWALRERARQQVTVHALAYRMKKEGFKHNKRDYDRLLKLMASQGAGELKTDAKGAVIALTGIRATLQSVGKAVCGGSPRLDSYRSRAKYVAIRPDTRVVLTPAPYEPVRLTFTLDTHPVTVSIPGAASTDAIARLIEKLRGTA